MVFECHKCQYRTTVKCNWEKHLKTKKHQLIVKNLKASVKSVELHPKNVESSDLKSINYEPNKSKKIIQNSELMCKWCMRYLSRKDSLQRHLMTCKNRIIFEKSQKVLNEVDFKCKYCNLNCANQSNLNRHFKTCPVLKITLNVEKEKEIKERNDKCPQVSTNDPGVKCFYCHNLYANRRSLNKHMYTCNKRKEEIQKIENENEKNIMKIENEKRLLKAEKEKEEALNKEKDLRLSEQAKAIEIAKNTQNITINNTTNKTINFLNSHFGNMIAMEQFLNALEHTHQLTIQERKDLLNAYYDCGIDVFARNFSYIMKENCKRQLESQGIKDMKLIPLFCSDGNLRSHKEKQLNGWKTSYDNQSINHMINISNQQIYDTYHKLVPVSGRERNRVFNEIKKNNHQNNFKKLENTINVDIN